MNENNSDVKFSFFSPAHHEHKFHHDHELLRFFTPPAISKLMFFAFISHLQMCCEHESER
jgi:hypothetical protein